MSRLIINDTEFSSHETFCLACLSHYVQSANAILKTIETVRTEGIQDHEISKRLNEKAHQISEVITLITSISENYSGRTQLFLSTVEEIDQYLA